MLHMARPVGGYRCAKSTSRLWLSIIYHSQPRRACAAPSARSSLALTRRKGAVGRLVGCLGVIAPWFSSLVVVTRECICYFWPHPAIGIDHHSTLYHVA